MRKKMAAGLMLLIFSGGVAAALVQYESHSHSEMSAPVLGHSGRLDSNGGHNCSEKSKRKGLCTGYHKHR